jgi:hypothetical protein
MRNFAHVPLLNDTYSVNQIELPRRWTTRDGDR